MKISVVIPNWNGVNCLRLCLKSLERQSLRTDIIVVDNGSSDDSVYMVEEEFPEITLLKLHENTGFTGGVNAGIQYALQNDYQAVALFNNDAVAHKDWLKNLSSQIKPGVGIVTGKLLRDDKTHFDSTGDFYSTYGIPFPRGRNQKDIGQYNTVEEVFGASGGASLYSVEMLKQIGLFDKRYFAYYEDVDISFRARLNGWKIVYTPDAVAYHAVGHTSSKMGDFTRYHSIKNFLILYTKCMPAKLYWKYFPRFFYQFLRTTARSFADKKPHIWAKSVLSFIGFLPSIATERWKIHKDLRNASTQEIDAWLHKGRAPKIPDL